MTLSWIACTMKPYVRKPGHVWKHRGFRPLKSTHGVSALENGTRWCQAGAIVMSLNIPAISANIAHQTAVIGKCVAGPAPTIQRSSTSFSFASRPRGRVVKQMPPKGHKRTWEMSPPRLRAIVPCPISWHNTVNRRRNSLPVTMVTRTQIGKPCALTASMSWYTKKITKNQLIRSGAPLTLPAAKEQSCDCCAPAPPKPCIAASGGLGGKGDARTRSGSRYNARCHRERRTWIA
mmetsp:Transcript_28458/g.81833  ORF Transcript_28458/g.81833 Transcript_28458/m.81833 type:complete len:234 (+) Transcript_28458:784-1485(+)